MRSRTTTHRDPYSVNYQTSETTTIEHPSPYLDALKSSTKPTTTQLITEATKPVPDQPNDFPSLPTREVSIWDPRPTVSSILSRNGASSSRAKVRVPSPVRSRVSQSVRTSSPVRSRVSPSVRTSSPVRSRVVHSIRTFSCSKSVRTSSPVRSRVSQSVRTSSPVRSRVSQSVRTSSPRPIYFKGAGHILSIFYPCTIVYKGMSFPSSEHLYQYKKAVNIQIFIWQNKFGMQRQPMKLKSFPN